MQTTRQKSKSDDIKQKHADSAPIIQPEPNPIITVESEPIASSSKTRTLDLQMTPAQREEYLRINQSNKPEISANNMDFETLPQVSPNKIDVDPLSDGNLWADPVVKELPPPTVKEIPPLYEPPNLLITIMDSSMRSMTNDVKKVTDKLGVVVNESEQLAIEWKGYLHELRVLVDSLDKIPWKKTLITSAAILGTLAFVWKMISLRSIPLFASNILGALPMPSIPTNTSVPIPKPESTVQALMETPLTPMGIVFTIGGATIALTCLKALAWVLRKSPK